MLAKSLLSLCLFLCSLYFNGCGRGTTTKQSSSTAINNVPISAWKQLASKKIYYGHQSVGSNIMEGVEELIKEHRQINLNIIKTTSATFTLLTPVFVHSEIGKNG